MFISKTTVFAIFSLAASVLAVPVPQDVPATPDAPAVPATPAVPDAAALAKVPITIGRLTLNMGTTMNTINTVISRTDPELEVVLPLVEQLTTIVTDCVDQLKTIRTGVVTVDGGAPEVDVTGISEQVNGLVEVIVELAKKILAALPDSDDKDKMVPAINDLLVAVTELLQCIVEILGPIADVAIEIVTDALAALGVGADAKFAGH